MPDRTSLDVGPIPTRKGVWLCATQGSTVRVLAKFRSEEAAKTFTDIMREAADHGVAVSYE